LKTYISLSLAIIIPLLIMVASTQSSSTLTITVQTSKQSYDINESIEVYGYLAFNGAPVSDNPVAIEVQNPNGDPVVTRSAQTDSYGAYNLTFKLSSDAKLGTYTVYVSSSYKGETATSNTTFTVAHIAQTTIEIEGQTYAIITESNATITNATANKNSLHFTSSSPTGKTAYVNTTLPVELNQTEIKVYIDQIEITPPPFPIITTNGTHYFIYFEFTLSTHEITIEYATTNIAITNITFSKQNPPVNETMQIYVTIENQGNYNETFQVSVNYTRILDPLIGTQTITLAPGQSVILNYKWTPNATGRYKIKAYTSDIPNDINPSDNTKIIYLYVTSGVHRGGGAGRWAVLL
jgi:methionine-rich copper-binding protein CopC